MDVKAKNIIITGGSLGIGKETAKSLVEKGANVLITGRSEERLQNAKLYTNAEIFEFDIADFDNLTQNAKKCLELFDNRVDENILCGGLFLVNLFLCSYYYNSIKKVILDAKPIK